MYTYRCQRHTLMNTRPHLDNLFVDETQLIYQKVTQIVQVIRPTFNPDSEHNKAILYCLFLIPTFSKNRGGWEVIIYYAKIRKCGKIAYCLFKCIVLSL